MTSETIAIEYLDMSNTWRTVQGGVINNSQMIAHALKNVKASYPSSRVRAVGQSSGRLYDMIG
jgi:predicted NAD/FAD-binding protein